MNPSPDPLTHCRLYRDKGCAHVDSFLCDVNMCSMLKEYTRTLRRRPTGTTTMNNTSTPTTKLMAISEPASAIERHSVKQCPHSCMNPVARPVSDEMKAIIDIVPTVTPATASPSRATETSC